jgi:hypothetical protein
MRNVGWTYDNNIIITIDSSTKELVYNTNWAYNGTFVHATGGGAGQKAYYLWTVGVFFKASVSKLAYLNIAMQILYDGTYWKYGWWWADFM